MLRSSVTERPPSTSIFLLSRTEIRYSDGVKIERSQHRYASIFTVGTQNKRSLTAGIIMSLLLWLPPQLICARKALLSNLTPAQLSTCLRVCVSGLAINAGCSGRELKAINKAYESKTQLNISECVITLLCMRMRGFCCVPAHQWWRSDMYIKALRY